MTQKRKVDDSELEQVTGGAGAMDPGGSQKLDQAGSGSGDSNFDTAGHDLGNDMILTETDRE